MIKVSVILPSLNVAGFIERCVLSAANQSLREIEILCVDGGSTDGTLRILRRLAAEEPRIRLMECGVQSYGAQVNAGIRAARGEYIGILETDDFAAGDMYQALYQAAEEGGKPDMVKADWEEFVETGREQVFFPVSCLWGREELYGKVISAFDCPWLFQQDINIWKGIYRKSFLTEKGIWFQESPGAAFQDLGFAVLTLSKAERILYLRRSLYRYQKGRAGASSSNPRALRFAYQEWRRLLEEGLLPGKALDCPYVWQRMADSFLGEYEKVLGLLDYNRDHPLIGPYYQWFRQRLAGPAGRADFPARHENREGFERLAEALFEPEKHREGRRREGEALRRLEEKVLGAGEIIIFGCGIRGRRAREFLLLRQREAKAFCDSRPELQGGLAGGLPVFSPRECVQRFPSALYLTAAKGRHTEMRRQLAGLGILEDRIIGFPD